MSAANFVTACRSAWSAQDLSNCKPLGLDAGTWIAALTALIGILWFTTQQVIRWRRATRSGDSYVASSLGRSRFRNLCRSIKPYMDDNYRIFSRFGPNGGGGGRLPKKVRYELGIWYQLREEIVENNTRIRALITANLSAVPIGYRPTFNQWLDHIDAFKAHVLDTAADYREHQFPQEASEIVTRYA